MCGYFCIECVDCMFKGENLTRFTSLFSPSNFENNDKVILNYFLNQNSTRMVDKKKKKQKCESVSTISQWNAVQTQQNQ